jgi:putative thioredoxin
MTTQSSTPILNVTAATFDREVLERSNRMPVIVDFWAPWCGPCRLLGPMLEEAVRRAGGALALAKVNSDEEPELSLRHRVQGIPAVKVFVDGKVADEFVGAIPELQLRRFLERFIPTEADRLAEAARGHESAGRWEEALRGYRDALAMKPEHAASLTGQLRVLVQQRRWDEAQAAYDACPGPLQLTEEIEALKTRLELFRAAAEGPSRGELEERLRAQPEACDARYQLALRDAAEGRYREALEGWLTIVRRDRQFMDDGARKMMLRLFGLIGPRAPLTEEYREKLARAIF